MAEKSLELIVNASSKQAHLMNFGSEFSLQF